MSLKDTFYAWNQQLMDSNVHIDTKRDIVEKVKDQVRTTENIGLAIKAGLFFGLAALAKNVKTDEDTLRRLMVVLCNLTACDTEGYTILTNEGCQNLIIEYADKTLSDEICEVAIWCIANLAVESASATKIIVQIGCFDRVLEIYQAKSNTKFEMLHSTTAWCISCLLYHKALEEEDLIKIMPTLKLLLEKQHTSESYRYLKLVLKQLIEDGSQKIYEELEKNLIFTTLFEGFLKCDNTGSSAYHFYLEVFETIIDDKATTKYITSAPNEVYDHLIKFALENQTTKSVLPKLMENSGDVVKRFHNYPGSYEKLYKRLANDHSQTSVYLRILVAIILKGSKEARESLVKAEHSAKDDFFRAIIRSIPLRFAEYDSLVRFLAALNETLKIGKEIMADVNVIHRTKNALLENKELVKKFLDKQKDQKLQDEVKELYEIVAIQTEAAQKQNSKSTKKVQVEVDDSLKGNLPLKDDDDEDGAKKALARKFKRMSTMAQTALDATEFLQNAGASLRKTRNQTKKANEGGNDEEEEVKKSSSKKKKSSTKKSEKKLSKALPDHPAIRRTKTMEETLAAAKAFLSGNQKGHSARKSLRSATRAAKKLRRTRTMAETIKDNKGLVKNYGRGKRAKDEVDYTHLFFKRVKKF